VLASGLLGILSISVVLWALSRSAVGPVSALRESSVLFATIIGVAVHREAATFTDCARLPASCSASSPFTALPLAIPSAWKPLRRPPPGTAVPTDQTRYNRDISRQEDAT